MFIVALFTIAKGENITNFIQRGMVRICGISIFSYKEYLAINRLKYCYMIHNIDEP